MKKLLTICTVITLVILASAARADVWVDDNFDDTTAGWGVTHFDNITDGVGAVADGNTVNVAAGSYNEHIINQFAPYNKSFDLIGAGANVVTWTAPNGQYPLQLDQQSTVSYEVSGFKFIGDGAHCIKFAGGGFDDLDVYDNVFDDVNAAGTDNFGVFMCRIVASRTGGVSSVRVHNNVFTTEKGICMSNTTEFDIYDNEFNVDVQGIYSAAGCSTGYTIGDHNIYQNTFDGMSGDAIMLDYWADGHPAYYASAINHNNFESIGGYAANVTTDRGITENANCNWWGDASGAGGAGPGSGETVTAYVDVSTWLDASYPGGNCIPEPATLGVLLLGGLLGVLGKRRRA